jgi:hypothetical protein
VRQGRIQLGEHWQHRNQHLPDPLAMVGQLERVVDQRQIADDEAGEEGGGDVPVGLGPSAAVGGGRNRWDGLRGQFSPAARLIGRREADLPLSRSPRILAPTHGRATAEWRYRWSDSPTGSFPLMEIPEHHGASARTSRTTRPGPAMMRSSA